MLERPKPSHIPDKPGSYQFRDSDGRVIYVGKASSLRSRIASYFQPLENLHPRTASLVSTAESVEWIVVANEVEALILEHNLIQQHHPRFNIRMRDDKSYPFLAITTDQQWPRAGIMRGVRRRGVRYFGPYPHQYAIRETLDLLLRTFPVRTCSDAKFTRHSRLGKPCLLFHIERCCGPCVGEVTGEQYGNIVADLSRFLKGDTKQFVSKLHSEMEAAAKDLNFELAARLRDRLELIGKAIEKQQMVGGESFNADVFGVFQDEIEAAIQVFFVRKGRVVGRKGFLVDKVEDLDESALISEILERYYSDAVLEVPIEVLVPMLPDDVEVHEKWLSGLRRGPVHIRVARRGEKRSLALTVESNATVEFKRNRMSRASDHNARAKALNALADELGLTVPPLRIECFDMSHLQGSNYVGSMVVMEDGLLKKSEYRRFKVNVGKNDDYAAMYEVLGRRLARLTDCDDEDAEHSGRPKRFSYPPSLIVVDGGRGQLSMAEKALVESGYEGEISLAGLAKQFEEVFVPGRSEPIRIRRTSEALYLLQQLRDEAHRFAISYHRQLRDKAMTKSVLQDVPGMGPVRTKRVLAHFGGMNRLKAASIDELQEIDWLPSPVAKAIYERLHGSFKRS